MVYYGTGIAIYGDFGKKRYIFERFCGILLLPVCGRFGRSACENEENRADYGQSHTENVIRLHQYGYINWKESDGLSVPTE